VDKINQQMSHMTAKRIVGKGQLDQEHWKKIKETIDAEVKPFESKLTDNYKKIWRQPTSIEAGSAAAASSMPSSTQTTITPKPKT
jgi:hypothetical protein